MTKSGDLGGETLSPNYFQSYQNHEQVACLQAFEFSFNVQEFQPWKRWWEAPECSKHYAIFAFALKRGQSQNSTNFPNFIL